MPHVLHATDFSNAGEVAFAHALALALVHEAELTLLHVGEGEVDWDRFPGVRPRLAAWGLLPAGADKKDVERELGVRVRKLALGGRLPAEAILETVERYEPDVVVLASRAGGGLGGVFRRSVSRPVALSGQAATLIVPEGAHGFVALENGGLTLRRALIAVDREPDPKPAIANAANLLRALAEDGAEVELLHVGDAKSAPDIPDSTLPNARLTRKTLSGDPAEAIAARAEEIDADVIVLATEGRRGLLDALRGSVTERVLGRAKRPVLAVPAR